MTGQNEGIKPKPENQIKLESGHLLELEKAETTRMISLIAPHHLLSEESIVGLTDEKIVEKYQGLNYGYRRFTRIKGEIVAKGEEGEGRKFIAVDIKIPGIVYFNGVLEDLDSYIESHREGLDPSGHSDWAKQTRDQAKEIGASRMIHVQRHVSVWGDGPMRSMGNFDTYFFGPDDVLLQEGHPSVYNHSTDQEVPHPRHPLRVG